MAFTNASIEELRNWAETNFPAGSHWAGKYENQQKTKWLIRSPWREDTHASYVLDLEKTHAFDRTEPVGETMRFSELAARLGLPEPGEPLREKGTSPAPWPEDNHEQARIMWRESPVAVDHPYLKLKGITTREARVTAKTYSTGDFPTKSGILLIPARDLDAQLQGVERVYPPRPGETKWPKYHWGGKLACFSGDSPAPGKRLFLGEGFATVHAIRRLTGEPAAEVFGLPCFKTFAEAAKKKYPTCELVFCPDHIDNEQQRKQAEDLKAFGPVVLIPQERREKYDWWNEVDELGIDAARITFKKALEEAEGKTSPKRRKFSLELIGDIELRPPQFLVRGIIEKDSVVSIFGAPESGKSFFCLDMCLCVAAGCTFHGHSVDGVTNGAPAIYICGEGRAGIVRRAAAWSKHREIPLKGLPFLLSAGAADFLDEQGLADVIEAADAVVERHGKPAIIAVDTLNRSFGCGDENSTKDMSAFVMALDTLRLRYPGSVVVVVHHSGVMETERGRGSSVLKGAIDVEFKVEKKGESLTLENKKMKEAPKIAPLFFELKDIPLGETETGEEYKSAVLIRMDRRSEETEQKPLSPAQHFALETYREAAATVGRLNDRGQFIGVHLDDWRPIFYKRATHADQKSKEKAFLRGRNELRDRGKLRVENDFYFPAGDLSDFETAEFEKVLKEVDESNRRRRHLGDIQETCLHETGVFRRQTETCVLGHVSMSPTVSEEYLTDSTKSGSVGITKKGNGGSSPRGEKTTTPEVLSWYREQPEKWRSELEAKAREDWSPIMARTPEDAVEASIVTAFNNAHERPVERISFPGAMVGKSSPLGVTSFDPLADVRSEVADENAVILDLEEDASRKERLKKELLSDDED